MHEMNMDKTAFAIVTIDDESDEKAYFQCP